MQRERSQVTLAAIAAQTKIKAALLEALERDDISQWPSGIFRRAYLRDYARAIGLDPEAVVREFLELHPDPVPAFVPGGETDPDSETSMRQAGGLRRIVGAMAAVPTFFQRIQQTPAPLDAGTADVRIEIDAPSAAAPRVDVTPAPAVRPAPIAAPPPGPAEVDLPALADVCTRLARLVDLGEFPPLLDAAAQVLDAVGLIVWAWDPPANALRPALAHGYSDMALARVAPVSVDAANAVAAAFRASEACIVDGDERHTGAVVAPLLAPGGCAGVLAVELRDRGEQRDSIRAVVTILAAQLATLLGSAACANVPADPQNRPDAFQLAEDGPFVHQEREPVLELEHDTRLGASSGS